MEDPLTEDPPPSRFFDEDLNNFAQPSPPLPPPTLHFTTTPTPTTPTLLIVAVSSPSIHLLHAIPSKTLVGTLTLPESPKPSHIYSLPNHPSTLLISLESPVSPERSHASAKVLLDQIGAPNVLILGSVQSRNFRGRLAPDEEVVFKLETVEERGSGDSTVKGVEYFPSGSLIDGVAAALLGRCQMKRIKGTLCVSWPERGRAAVGTVKALLEQVLPEVEFNFTNGDLGVYKVRDSKFNSDMYT